jgi:FtsZ-interacting cell division protein ZipA
MKISNDRMKKWFILAGGLLICAVLVFMISSQFKKEPIEEVGLPNNEDIVDDVVVEKNKEINIDGDKNKIDDKTAVNTEKEDKENMENSEKEIDVPAIKTTDKKVNNGVDKGTSQTIQGDVKKPKEPSKEKLTDPTKKPDGEKLEEPPENVDHDKVKKPEEAPKKKDEPQGGDKKNGKIYVPGFGWIDDIGEGEGTKVDGDGDINKQIGDMN